MARILLAALILFLGLPAYSYAVPAYNPATGHWYDTVPGGLHNWADAEAGAVALGGHLVTINDAAEQQWLLDNGWGAPFFNYWVGLNDIVTEGTFVWVSGEPVTYTNWAGGEPNNSGGNEDAVVMNWNSWPGLWNDVPVDFAATGIVEYLGAGGPVPDPSTTVPEPSTMLLLGSGLVGIIGFGRNRLFRKAASSG